MRGLLLVLLMATCPHAAGEWVRVAESGGLTIYFDPETVSRTESTVKLLTMQDHAKPRATMRGWLYRSVKTENEFDCKQERMRSVHSVFHFGQMGGGMVVANEYSGGWTPLAQDEASGSLWKLACAKK